MNRCLSDNELERCASGEAPAQLLAAGEQHIAGCNRCSKRLRASEAGAELIARIRDSEKHRMADAAAAAREDAVRRLLKSRGEIPNRTTTSDA